MVKELKCSGCGVFKHPSKIYSYVDGNNISITKNSLEYCETCYIDKYGIYN